MEKTNIYLISDCTGDTLRSICSAVMDRFSNVKYEEKVFSMVRNKQQVDKIIETISEEQGIVMYTLVDDELRKYLKKRCGEYDIKYIPVLSSVILQMSEYLGLPTNNIIGKNFQFNQEYVSRMNAINFSINHDDGQNQSDISDAQIIIVGVSRTSKSPTSIYLAYRGYRTANIPFVGDGKNLEYLRNLKGTLVVGLIITADILSQIRRSRMIGGAKFEMENYTNLEQVNEEIDRSRKFFIKNNIPFFDVSRKSVEETSARIIQMYEDMQNGLSK